ncbi:MAG TPA: BamA/TamA family outer membrane protein [Flavobacterium sp.]|jgi:outer membrane protein assembly factor BamA
MRHSVLQICIIIGLIGNVSSSNAQSFFKKYFDNLINNKSPIEQPQLLVYPTLAYAPETTWEIGLSSLYVYYAKRDTTNRLSEINGFTFFTLENQYGLWFDHAIYTDKDRWFLLGKLRFQSFPLYYHGMGTNTPEDYTARVDATQILIKERVLRKLKKNLFLGFEVDYQSLSAVDFVVADPANTTFELPLGSNGSNNLGFGIGLVQDNRHNVLNVRDGFFSELAFLHSNPAWGSTYKFTSIYSDTRIYKPMGKRNVFAAQLLGQFNFGDVPFNQLAQLGGESIMRGYYYGRYRDNHQLAAQMEYRFLPIPLGFTNRIGAVAFAGTGTVFNEINKLAVPNLKFSAGAGLRFLLFPKKDIWTRLDYAVTKEGGGFYLFIGESF